MRRFIKCMSFQMSLFGCLSMGLISGAFAQAPWEQTYQAVHELMQQETEYLMQNNSNETIQSMGQQTSAHAQECPFGCPHEIELLSLYGVGSEIYVQLRHQDKDYLFVPGQKHPLGALGAEFIVLESVLGPCVELLVAQEKVQQCIVPTFP